MHVASGIIDRELPGGVGVFQIEDLMPDEKSSVKVAAFAEAARRAITAITPGTNLMMCSSVL